jgi:hypothetical protein
LVKLDKVEFGGRGMRHTDKNMLIKSYS